LVVISGWSHLFHDENVPAREAFRLLQNTARRVRSLTEAGQPVLATHPEEPVTPRLRPLGRMLAQAADGVARLREEEGLILVSREKPPDRHGRHTLVISQADCQSFIRGHRHQELPVANCAVRKIDDSSSRTAQSAGRVRGGAAARPSRSGTRA
jgi:hypothetical protein